MALLGGLKPPGITPFSLEKEMKTLNSAFHTSDLNIYISICGLFTVHYAFCGQLVSVKYSQLAMEIKL